MGLRLSEQFGKGSTHCRPTSPFAGNLLAQDCNAIFVGYTVRERRESVRDCV